MVIGVDRSVDQTDSGLDASASELEERPKVNATDLIHDYHWPRFGVRTCPFVVGRTQAGTLVTMPSAPQRILSGSRPGKRPQSG